MRYCNRMSFGGEFSLSAGLKLRWKCWHVRVQELRVRGDDRDDAARKTGHFSMTISEEPSHIAKRQSRERFDEYSCNDRPYLALARFSIHHVRIYEAGGGAGAGGAGLAVALLL